MNPPKAKPDTMAHFLLVHGAWHGGWCWHRLSPLLQAQGHKITTPDLPGLGDDATAPEQAGLEAYGNSLAEVLDKIEEPVILVGHSMGGMAISAAAELRPDRVAALVYLCAFLPSNGQSIKAIRKSYFEDRWRADPFDDPRTRVVPPPGDRKLKEVFYAHCPETDLVLARRLLRPQPAVAFRDSLFLSKEKFAAVPKIYVECLRDGVIPIGMQRAMAQGRVSETLTIDTGHSPLNSEPEKLADLLDGIAGRY